MSGLNDIWEVVSFEHNQGYVDKGYAVYFSGSYEECMAYVMTTKSGRIKKLFRTITRPPETNRETIERLNYLAPKTNYAKDIYYD